MTHKIIFQYRLLFAHFSQGPTTTRSTLVGVAVVSIAEIEARHAKRRGSSTERTGGVEVDVPIRMNGLDVGKLTGFFIST